MRGTAGRPGRARWAGLLAVAASAAIAAGAQAAPTRRVEAVGASPVEQGRQAAVRAALDQAVLAVARGLLGVEEAPGPVSSLLGGKAEDYVVRYRVLDDVGERRSQLLNPAQAEREYVVVVEAYVDRSRIEAELREQGRLAAATAPVAGDEFRVFVSEPPSYRAISALSARLRDLGASQVVPTRFTAERVEIRVKAPLRPSALLDRLVAEPPAGIDVIPVSQQEGALWLRLHERAAPLGPTLPE